jgi:membrane protein YdbS with pleckstrin-like domain
MSEEYENAELIRPSLKSLWLYWLLLAISAPLLIAPEALLAALAPLSPGLSETVSPMILRVIGVIGAGYAGVAQIGYVILANRYYLTDDEIVEIYGLIQRNRKATRLEHIRRVTVEVGFIGRILGYGDVLYFTSGSGGVDVRLKNISDPEGLASRVDAMTRESDKPAGRSEDEVATDTGLLDVMQRLLHEVAGLREDVQLMKGDREKMLELSKASTKYLEYAAHKVGKINATLDASKKSEISETGQ